MSKTISNSDEFQEDNKTDNVMKRMGSLCVGAFVVDWVANLGWWSGNNSSEVIPKQPQEAR